MACLPYLSPFIFPQTQPLTVAPKEPRSMEVVSGFIFNPRTLTEQKETSGTALIGTDLAPVLTGPRLQEYLFIFQMPEAQAWNPQRTHAHHIHFSGGDSGSRGNEHPAHPLGSEVQPKSQPWLRPKLWVRVLGHLQDAS